MLSNFGPSQGRKGLENGPLWDHKWLKNGSKPWFSKHDPSPVPFLTEFWSQNSPFSRHFVTLEGPKWLAMGSKRAHFTCLGTVLLATGECSAHRERTFLGGGLWGSAFDGREIGGHCSWTIPTRGKVRIQVIAFGKITLWQSLPNKKMQRLQSPHAISVHIALLGSAPPAVCVVPSAMKVMNGERRQ